MAKPAVLICTRILLTVNPGKYYDVYANDQDWALVYYLDIMHNQK
jgi:hypothetical protein